MDKSLIIKRLTEFYNEKPKTEFAKLIEIDQSSLSKIENGKLNLTIKHLYNIVSNFGIMSVPYILTGKKPIEKLISKFQKEIEIYDKSLEFAQEKIRDLRREKKDCSDIQHEMNIVNAQRQRTVQFVKSLEGILLK